ncbi:MAG: AraC family transcriptional regulator [Methylacidiphilales bacterium]|nr:AraC family transcriptional regulator [Candidatus Methylacidiphilales bacterium]
MLRHLVSSARRFGVRPMPPHPHKYWEFYAVINGKVAAFFPKADQTDFRDKSLWVFPPETSHGWISSDQKKARIIAFYFSFVPPPLDKIARCQVGYHMTKLSDNEIKRIVIFERELRSFYRQTSPFSSLLFHRCLLELSLIALKNVPVQKLSPVQMTPAMVVDAAIIWFTEHLNENPKLDQVARAARVSTSHLRRLFLLHKRNNPQSVFTRIRLEHAMQLMLSSDDKIDSIAHSCGFSSAVNFCRAFKVHVKCTPDVWRKKRREMRLGN